MDRYVENQDLLNRNDVLVKEQQELIHRLEQRLRQYEGPGAQGKAAGPQRVKELQAQVATLQVQARQGVRLVD